LYKGEIAGLAGQGAWKQAVFCMAGCAQWRRFGRCKNFAGFRGGQINQSQPDDYFQAGTANVSNGGKSNRQALAASCLPCVLSGGLWKNIAGFIGGMPWPKRGGQHGVLALEPCWRIGFFQAFSKPQAADKACLFLCVDTVFPVKPPVEQIRDSRGFCF
jgi:hypothetical protein